MIYRKLITLFFLFKIMMSFIEQHKKTRYLFYILAMFGVICLMYNSIQFTHAFYDCFVLKSFYLDSDTVPILCDIVY